MTGFRIVELYELLDIEGKRLDHDDAAFWLIEIAKAAKRHLYTGGQGSRHDHAELEQLLARFDFGDAP